MTKMPYYHVRIRKNKSSRWKVLYDLNLETLESQILVHFRKQKPFMFDSSIIRFSEIDDFGITETEMSSSEILNETKAKRFLKKFVGYEATAEARDDYLTDQYEIFSSGTDVTNELIKGIKPPDSILPKVGICTSETSSLQKDKVFIVHGRDDRQALLLQKYLKDKLKVNAIVFDDLPDKGRTIIEQIEFIRQNIFYAFVLVTPDDVGCLREEIEKIAAMVVGLKTVPNQTVNRIFESLHERARQNVVFELGLFIGALGRENVCCLKQKSVKEKPSDIDGILYKEFNKEVTEIFHELADELNRNKLE